MLGWCREGKENKEDMNHSGYIFQFLSMVKSLENWSPDNQALKKHYLLHNYSLDSSKNPVPSVTICINRNKV